MTALVTPSLLDAVRTLAEEAGQLVLKIYHSDFAVEAKDDKSPVTQADVLAEEAILKGLAHITPDIPVISEEAAAAGHMPQLEGRFWLVDPLDGTKEFVKRNGEFTVNIALIESGRPVLGVVLAPAQNRLWTAAGLGTAQAWTGSRPRPVAARLPPADGLVVVASRSHNDPEKLKAWLNGQPVLATKSAGSSLKFCLVAGGEADLYPRFGRTMEWDTAAGHAVLLAAGGDVVMTDGQPLRYGKPGYENPHFIAIGRR